MTDETEAKLVDAVKTALSTICRADKDGNFYSEIYADYRDEIGDHNMKKICDSDVPEETFWEMLDEWYCEATWDEEDSIIKQVLQDDVVAAIVTGLDEDEYEIRELIRDYFYVKYPEDHFLREDVLVDLVVDTGDANYDFVSNTIGGHYNNRDNKIPEESSLLWLARQQGYKKSELKKALNDCGICDSKFLKSIYIETANCSSHMNALVFLAKMELKDYFRRSYDTEDEFICDMWGDCDEEEREYILDELPITTDRIRENFEEWMLNPDESLFCGTVPEELETLFHLTEKRHRFMEYPYSDNLLPGIIPWQNDMLFDCVDRMCSEQMNDGRTIIYNGVFWRIPANGENLSEILTEINDTVRGFANLLQIIHEIHNSEDLRNGCCNPQ